MAHVKSETASRSGKATVDGSKYTWTGRLSQTEFTGTFTSSRNNGDWRMTRK